MGRLGDGPNLLRLQARVGREEASATGRLSNDGVVVVSVRRMSTPCILVADVGLVRPLCGMSIAVLF